MAELKRRAFRFVLDELAGAPALAQRRRRKRRNLKVRTSGLHAFTSPQREHPRGEPRKPLPYEVVEDRRENRAGTRKARGLVGKHGRPRGR